MTLCVWNHPFAYEMECTLRLFFPGGKIDVTSEAAPAGDVIVTELRETGGKIELYVSVTLEDFREEDSRILEAAAPDRERERLLAVLLFGLLVRKTGERPPWGIMTGIRPVRRCHTMEQEGLSREEARRVFTNDFLVSESKAGLALRTADVEKKVLAKNHPKAFSLYISIPFCPTRCLYCSFVSHDIQKTMKLVPGYVRLLCEEIRRTGEIAARCGLTLQTVYMGGGTPTTLEAGQLAQILGTVRESFDLGHLQEFTVEAGRPDTLTVEKLSVLREYGAGRISVNPQTMDDGVLRTIGREHTAAQVVEGVALARQAGFACLNMDLIAGLPGDTTRGFARSLQQVLALEPENITVHTLTVKRSSDLRKQEGVFEQDSGMLPEMLDNAHSTLSGAGYLPYYLYRQKGTRGNLENTGYTKPGFEGIYNVYIMEEVHTVLAVGAGAVTKLCAPPGTVQRVFNYKFPYEYIGRFDEMLRRKASVGEFYESDQ